MLFKKKKDKQKETTAVPYVNYSNNVQVSMPHSTSNKEGSEKINYHLNKIPDKL